MVGAFRISAPWLFNPPASDEAGGLVFLPLAFPGEARIR